MNITITEDQAVHFVPDVWLFLLMDLFIYTTDY